MKRGSALESKAPRTENQGGWMITLADLLSLLLTFFVLLFSMSTIRFDSWKAVVDSMTDQFNENRPAIDIKPTDMESVKKPSAGVGLNLNYLKVFLERSIADQGAFTGVVVHRDGNRVIISIPEALLFQRKTSDLETGSRRPLRVLAGALSQIRNKLHVAGHSDAVPISSGRYRSNWELSMARARIVAGILTEYGYRRPITVIGYANSQNAVKGSGVSAQDLDMDERVDIVISAEQSEGGIYGLF